MSVLKPYHLAISSHKGGTGVTTSAVLIAWLTSQQGFKVALLDSDPAKNHRLLYSGQDSISDWSNICFASAFSDIANHNFDLVISDGPSITHPDSDSILAKADGILLTCMADVLSLRTLPVASQAIAQLLARNHQTDFLGVLLVRFRDTALQIRLRDEIQRLEGDLFLHPHIPEDSDIVKWALFPDSAPPFGPALHAYSEIVSELTTRLHLLQPV